MHLYFHKEANGNFGDDLNAWFWDSVLPGFRDWDAEVTLVGVGTLLNRERLQPLQNQRLLIAGTGVGYGSGPPPLPLPAGWDVRAVRGPLSARALNLPPEKAITDPAALVPLLPEFQQALKSTPKLSKPVWVPHHRSLERHNWQAACEAAGLVYLSPEEDAKKVIHTLARAPLVLAEAMHAAIIADAFRVPWVPLHIGSQFNRFKWQDWLASLELNCQPQPLFPKKWDQFQISLSQKLGSTPNFHRVVKALTQAAQGPAYLSDECLLQKRQAELLEVFQAIQQEYL